MPGPHPNVPIENLQMLELDQLDAGESAPNAKGTKDIGGNEVEASGSRCCPHSTRSVCPFGLRDLDPLLQLSHLFLGDLFVLSIRAVVTVRVDWRHTSRGFGGEENLHDAYSWAGLVCLFLLLPRQLCVVGVLIEGDIWVVEEAIRRGYWTFAFRIARIAAICGNSSNLPSSCHDQKNSGVVVSFMDALDTTLTSRRNQEGK
jgi:hypothetical protein